jgi:ATP synthase protein I
LQITIFGITFIVAILVASITGIIIGYTFGFSVFIGAIAGIFYLRLLAKSIGKIGKESNGFLNCNYWFQFVSFFLQAS